MPLMPHDPPARAEISTYITCEGSNRLARVPWFALEPAGIRQPVVHSRRLERDGLGTHALRGHEAEMPTTLETTKGQMDGFFSQLPL